MHSPHVVSALCSNDQFLKASVVACTFAAFMETLTISAYPDYSFSDRNMVYTLGSAFYGIYFIVSFPMFYRYV